MELGTAFPGGFVTLLLVAAAVSAIGFYKYIYFISLGYGFSIAALGVALLLRFAPALDVAAAAACLLLVAYGCRLGGYLLLRELKSSSYRSHMKNEIKDGRDMTLAGKLMIWLACVALYVLQVLPIFYRLSNGCGCDAFCLAGIAVMLIGLTMETVADAQKSLSKRREPNRFCDSGLFRLVRCPNYLGELIFWSGVLLFGLSALEGAAQWTLALCGYLGIVYIMFSGARRLEIRQNKSYGADPAYRAYVAETPILLPFIPLYSVEKYTFLVG